MALLDAMYAEDLVLIAIAVCIPFMFFMIKFVSPWAAARKGGVPISLWAIVGMWKNKINYKAIIQAAIVARMGGAPVGTARLVSHNKAGGNVMHVAKAIAIAAKIPGLTLSFDRAAQLDLEGHDLVAELLTIVKPEGPEQAARGVEDLRRLIGNAPSV